MVATKAFAAAARLQAKLLGLPDLAIAVVGHPFAAQDLQVTYSRADEAAAQIVQLLSAPQRQE
jgi:hypothetical protein